VIQNPDLIQLGKYIFDKRNMALSFENSTTELTSKEAELTGHLAFICQRYLGKRSDFECRLGR